MHLSEKKTVDMFKALCDINRVKILKLLQSGEKCGCVLLDNMVITQPTLSHHMKILCDSGIVSSRKEGKWMYYSISKKGAEKALEALAELTTTLAQTPSCGCK